MSTQKQSLQASAQAYFASSTRLFPTHGPSSPNPTYLARSPSSSVGNSKLGRDAPLDSRSTLASKLPSDLNSGVFSQPVITEITDDDDFTDEDDFSLWIARQADDSMARPSAAASTSKASTSRKSSGTLPRNLPITAPLVKLDSFTYKGIQLSPSVNIELSDGDFMKIVHIFRDTATADVSLRGWIFRRTRFMNGVLDRKLNELCWILHVDDDDPRDPQVQGLETAAVTDVVKRRRIRMTNQAFPALSFRDDTNKEAVKVIESDRVLVCRYKYLCFYPNARARESYAWCEKGFHRLQSEECDKGADNGVRDESLRQAWRGTTCHGGAQRGFLPGEKEFLRQEAVSNKGISSRSSLKVPSGRSYPLEDPMQRESVASLVSERELLQQAQFVANGKDKSPKYLDKTATDDDAPIIIASPLHKAGNGLRKGDGQTCPTPLQVFGEWPFDPRERRLAGGSNVFALGRKLRESSIHSQSSRQSSPQVVEIDAQVKTFSSLGTFNERYEGKFTSSYHPKSISPKKRSASNNHGFPSKPHKRLDRGSRLKDHDKNDFNNGRSSLCPAGSYMQDHDRKDWRETNQSDSDVTLGRSQSPLSVEEICEPADTRAYTVTGFDLSTPVLRYKDENGGRKVVGRSTVRDAGGLPDCPGRACAMSKILFPATTLPFFNRGKETGAAVDLTELKGSGSAPFSSWGSLNAPSSDAINQAFLSQPKSNPPVRNSQPKDPKTIKQASILASHSPFSTPNATFNFSQGFCTKLNRKPKARRPMDQQSVSHTSQANRRLSTVSSHGKQRYTFGDCFCGAGGMSRGAAIAGLRIKWGFDFNLAACQSYALNYFGTMVYNVWANQFSDASGDRKVDVCHLSPPCQFFSDAHTIQGKDDDMNTASLFAISNLLKKAKPRVVTLEQTSGLLRRHPIFFNAVVNMFTSQGFSIRWRILNCADFGLPQRRLRLFVIASW